jgi:hypothetical protein
MLSGRGAIYRENTRSFVLSDNIIAFRLRAIGSLFDLGTAYAVMSGRYDSLER